MLRVFTAATVARFSYALIYLALLSCVQHATSSYAVAGAAVGAYGTASLAMPLKARLIDFCGPRRILPLLSVGLGCSLAAVALTAFSGSSSAAAYIAYSALVGLLAPPVGPTMRALWAVLTPDAVTRQRAYSLDEVVEGVLYAIGPLLVAAVATHVHAGVVLLMAAGLNLIGTQAMVRAPALKRAASAAVETPTGRDAGRRRPQVPWSVLPRSVGRWLLGPVQRPRFAVLLLVAVAVSVGIGPIEVAVVARVSEMGHPLAVAGPMLAALAIATAVGGLAWGHLAHRLAPVPRSRQLAALVALAAGGAALAGWAPSLPLLGLALVLVGVASAPIFVIAYLSADDLSTDNDRTEATTWINTATNIGGSLGAAGAGLLIDTINARTAMHVIAAITALAALSALSARAALDSPTPPTRTSESSPKT
ncbi:MFS transporter [Kineococcus sp. NUM-3379]